jgi:hypothetical protein
MFWNFIFLILFSLSSLQAGEVKQGQETWGGDASALKFVKYGRLLGHELAMKKKCQEVFPVKSDVWNRLLDSTTVESTELQKKSQPGQIFFELYKWWFLKKEWKIESVLKAYAEQAGLQIESKQAQKILLHCLGDEELWIRNSNPSGKSKEIDLKKEMKLHLNGLLSMIESKKIKSLPNEFKIEEFKKMIELINNSDPTLNTKKMEFDTTPVSILFSGSRLKDAQNTVTKDKLILILNLNVWSILSIGQKKELLLHEVLGLMRLDDSRYQHSSRLMFDLDRKDYEVH